MRRISNLKRKKGKENEKFLTPISIIGTLLPTPSDQGDATFRIRARSGAEYKIVSDAAWESVLENYRWEEVRIKGLLDSANMSIIPQWVIPHGPNGETLNLSEEPPRKTNDFLNKLKKSMVDFVLAPATLGLELFALTVVGLHY